MGWQRVGHDRETFSLSDRVVLRTFPEASLRGQLRVEMGSKGLGSFSRFGRGFAVAYRNARSLSSHITHLQESLLGRDVWVALSSLTDVGMFISDRCF